MEFLRPLADTEYAGASASTSGTAATVATWKPGPQGVLVWGTQDMYVAVGVGVTATSASTPVPAYTHRFRFLHHRQDLVSLGV